jgi:fatty-acid desaturase
MPAASASAPVSFLDRVLDPPHYGYTREGRLYRPSAREILREFGSRMNVFASRRNWLPAFGWASSLSLALPLGVFLTQHFSWSLAAVGFVYSMILMGSHGTVWLHRYSTHRAFRFRHPLARAICRELVVKIIPEEIYVVSHYVHHHKSEKPGDPYNVHGGFLYCFLADANHQQVARDLTPEEYARVARLLDHTGVKVNTYAQYRRWGSLCHPLRTVLHFAANWAFWFGTFYALGGMALATCILGSAGVWAIGVRTYNFDGHGRGKDRRQEGIDFNTDDWAVNQLWPGYVAGEWHSNHHLYPNSARSGFLPYQLDLAWLFIRAGAAMGWVSSYRDNREDFLRDHYRPWLESRAAGIRGSEPKSAKPPTLPPSLARREPPQLQI